MHDPMRILICPLNWGLGHASRDVLVIQKLLEAGHEVILAGDGMPLIFLETEFPELKSIHLPSSIRITYFKHLPAWLKIFILSPFLLYEFITERYRLKKIVRKIRPDAVISDNRYGLWSENVKSILITHQCSIKFPGFIKFLEYPAALFIRLLIEGFDICWIPDYSGPQNLSGDLSHRFPLPSNASYIGPISRFSMPAMPAEKAYQASQTDQAEKLSDADLLILLSGPEPQRTRLEKIILKQIPGVPVSTVVLQGLPGKQEMKKIGPKHTLISHMPSALLKQLLQETRYIICRSGYTSIMDLVKMQKKAMIIPTPGQTEQEYLADYLTDKGIFLSCDQQNLDLLTAIQMLEKFEPIFPFPVEDQLTNHLEDL
jgi:UDP-N-acetylglucosamine:LPS N-acetylglucosamine transferase